MESTIKEILEQGKINIKELDSKDVLRSIYLSAINKSKLYLDGADEYYIPITDGDVVLLLRLLYKKEENSILSARCSTNFFKQLCRDCKIRQEILEKMALFNTSEMNKVVYVDPQDMFDLDNLDNPNSFLKWSKLNGVDSLPAVKPPYLTVTYDPITPDAATAIFLSGVADTIARYYDDDLLISFTSIYEANVHPLNKPDLCAADIQDTLIATIENENVGLKENEILTKKLYAYYRVTKEFKVLEVKG